MRALQSGKGFGELRADLNDLHYRRYQESHEERVSKEAADGERSSENLPRSKEHDYRADDPQQYAGGEAHDRGRGKTSNYVLQQAHDASGKDLLFAILGVI